MRLADKPRMAPRTSRENGTILKVWSCAVVRVLRARQYCHESRNVWCGAFGSKAWSQKRYSHPRDKVLR